MPDPDLYAQALAAVNAKDRPQARQLLAALVAADPRRGDAWLLLSTLVDDVDQSIDCLQKAIALDPANAKARHWLDLAARARARREAGLAPSEPVVEEDPDADFVDLEPEDRPVPRLGRYLLDFGFITVQQLSAALDHQRAAAQAGLSRQLGSILVEEGTLPQVRLSFALREQERVRAEVAAQHSVPQPVQ
jgi:tetratricopeptide (TPR) repeat protein